MPFLRLLKIKETKPDITPEPEVIAHSDENIDQQDNQQLELTVTPETLPDVPETVYDSESDSDSNIIQEESEVKAEGESIPEQIQEEQEPEAEIEIESESKPASESPEQIQEQELESESESESGEIESKTEGTETLEQTQDREEPEPESEQIEQIESETEGTETLEAIQEEAESESEPEELTAQEIESDSQTVSETPEDSQGSGDEQDLTETPEVQEESPANTANTETESEEFKLQYDVTSGKRYVDLVSTKTDFDKMLDELANISHDIIEHEAERFAKKYTGKFTQDNNGDKSEADAKKLEAFLGGYIANAAMILYDNGYRDAAIKRLDQAKNMLEARKKLEDETAAIHSRVEENNDMVDLSDILGLFGDG